MSTTLNFVTTTEQILLEIKEYHNFYPLEKIKNQDLFDYNPKIILFIVSILKNQMPPDTQLNNEEWLDLMDILNAQKITLVFYDKLKNFKKQISIPENILKIFQKILRLNSGQLIKTEYQLNEILSYFQKNKIDCIVLKGLGYAKLLYQPYYLRPLTDIDLLIKEAQFLQAKKLLLKLGYTATQDYFKNVKDLFYHEALMKEKSKYVELHWSLNMFPGLIKKIDPQEYFSNKIQIENIPVLNPTDALIYASIHLFFYHHNSLNLLWILDIVFLIEKIKSQNEWDEIFKKAQKLNAGVAVYHALYMATLWSDIALPHHLLDKNKWVSSLKTENKIIHNIRTYNKNRLTWFKIKWPRDMSFLKQGLLLIQAIKYKIKKELHPKKKQKFVCQK